MAPPDEVPGAPVGACAGCGGTFEPGALVDYGAHSAHSAEWAAGPLDVSPLTGSVRNKRRLVVTAARCTRCGLLAIYATEPVPRGW